MKQVLAERASKSDDIVASGDQIDMVFRPGQRALSLRAQKIWHALVKEAGEMLDKPITHRIPLATLYQRGLGHMSRVERLDALRELQVTLVEIKTRSLVVEGGSRIISGPLIDYVARDEDDHGILEWSFGRALRDAVANSDRWAVLSRRVVMAFESRYALRLYELMALRSGLKHKTTEQFTLDELRTRLGVPTGKLSSWVHLRQRAIDPAIAEINQLAGFSVSYTTVKKGRAIAAINLTWAAKNANDRNAAERELNAPKVGRKARRDNAAEQHFPNTSETDIVLEFPVTGSIGYTTWQVLALASLPKPARDVDLVAQDFRQWAKGKGISLRNHNITEIFSSFCSRQTPAGNLW